MEVGVEAMNISEGGEASKDRRTSRASKPDELERRSSAHRSSGNAGRRKPRSATRVDRNEGSNDEPVVAIAAEKKAPPTHGASFKKIFSRNKAPPPDP